MKKKKNEIQQALKLTNQNESIMKQKILDEVKGSGKDCYACGIGSIDKKEFLVGYNSQFTCIWV